MKVKKTIQYKIIKSNKNKKLKLNTTMRQYRKCVNFYLHKISQNTSSLYPSRVAAGIRRCAGRIR